uniref:bL21 family ribosomal protein n=1 Tax=Neisseria sicca TaxID=490 RepID=UPI0016497A8C
VGEKLKVEEIGGEVEREMEVREVLMIGEGECVKVGGGFMEGGKVRGKVVGDGGGEKVGILKMGGGKE